MIYVCAASYTASGFETATLNGEYTVKQSTHGGKHVYHNNSTNMYLWYDTVTDEWVISVTVGAAQVQWLSVSLTTHLTCPADTYTNEAGLVAIT